MFKVRQIPGRALFSQVGEAILPFILGEKLYGIFAKREGKTLCYSIFGENCMNF
jgi:hypothetical protein